MPLSSLSFRRADPGDIPAILELVTIAYRGDQSRQGWTTEADILDGQRLDAAALRDDMMHDGRLRDDSAVLLAETDGVLVGCAHIAHDGVGTGYFGMFAVRPGNQGSGHGKLILAEAERRVVSEWAVTAMAMTVITVREELIAFYLRRGYRRTGLLKPFPYGNERFGIPKRDDLRFEVLEKALTPLR